MFEDRKYDRLDPIPLVQEAARRYVEKGAWTGDFLKAVLCNDLIKAFAFADNNSASMMKEIVMWVYNDIPGLCHGSEKRYMAWINRGGIEGIDAEAKMERENA
jgi:hypothetical protein